MTNLKWQRPKTTRVYFHPPMSERMYTLWRDGKVIFAENPFALHGDYFNIVSSGIRFLFDGGEMDFRAAEYSVRDDGIPTHALGANIGGLMARIEVFATPGVHSAAYARLKVKNATEANMERRVGFMLRTAKECELIYEAPDVYRPFRSNLEEWRALPAIYTRKGDIFSDGERNISLCADMDFEYNRDTGEAYAEVSLLPGEERYAIFAYDTGRVEPVEWDKRYAECEAFWQGELARMTGLPEGIKADPKALSTVRNLTVQMLQCFCKIKDTEYTFARQGGLQRQVWTMETIPVLEALRRLGDFDDYIDPIMELYFKDFLKESGEMVLFGIPWAMVTGNVLYSFAKYAIHKGREFYCKYRDRAMKSFEWIRSTRLSVKETDELVGGLFPPMSSCDDPLVFQSWCNTDSFNIMGVGALADAAELYGDARAAEIRAEYEDYKRTARNAWVHLVKTRENRDELDMPFSPKGDNAEIAKKFVFGSGDSYFAYATDMPEDEAELILNYRKRAGIIKGGLYNRMPDKNRSASTVCNLDENGKCDVWYVSTREFYWFEYFMDHGRLDEAREILRDNERFAMTDEYYMLERYKVSDPYFTPWMPNASANGRTVNMMLDMAEWEEKNGRAATL